ncbi:MAG: ABC transporter substrate-binding protein [Ignavibacterium sp.]|nr:MAG: ABC transporter substrate-binding protein [Ignavibacterium sp.]
MRKHIVKILLLPIAVYLMYEMFATPQIVADDGKIHVRYWFVTDADDRIPYRVTQFNKTHDDIVVDATPLPFIEHENKVLTSILSGNPPDVVSLIAPVHQWASRMSLRPLTELIKDDNFDTTYVFPALWEEVNYEGHVFAIPTHTASYALFYNNKLFKEAGLDPLNPPNTWEEVREYSKKLTKMEDGQYTQIGFIPMYGNFQVAISLAMGLGAKFLSADGKTVHLNNEQMVQSLQWVLDYYSDYDYDEVVSFQSGFGYADQHGFLSEKVAMMILDHTFLDFIKKYRPDLDFSVSANPAFEGYNPASSTGNWWMGIPRGAKKVKAAWEFMKFAVSYDVQVKEATMMKGRLMPANINAAKDSSLSDDKNFYEILIDQMQYAKTPSFVPLVHSTFWREFAFAQERVIRHVQTPRQSLEQGNKVIQGDLIRAKEYDIYVWENMELEGY